jgi:hypothetical protein
MAAYEGPKWGLSTYGTAATVTWSFAELNLASQLSDRFTGYLNFDSALGSQYRTLVRAAMDAWEAVANIDLVEISDSANSNIRLGNRAIDGVAAPGQSSTVGETVYWSNGSGRMTTATIAFDTDAYTGTSFYQIAAHEIGHALGLDHSNLTSAVMYYMINSLNRAGVLTSDDISGIQHLYGAKVLAVSSLATLQTAFTNILRISPTSSDALSVTIALTSGGTVANPTFTQAQGLTALAGQVDAGQITLSKAIASIGHFADATTSVATLSYQFFTGRTPTAAGLDYLVHSSANPNDLNDPYYAKFNIENRYINFAVNLGKLGAGNEAFQAAYGGLSLSDTVRKAYTEIFGSAPTDLKISDILTSALSLGGQAMSRADYFAYYGADGPNGVGTKAAAVGFLLVEAVKADLGPYALANDKFMADLADGAASYNVNLKTAYALLAEPETAGVQAETYTMHVDGVVEIAGVSAGYDLGVLAA